MSAVTASPSLQAVVLAATRHPHGGHIIGLFILLVIVVVVVVLLMQRHKDRRTIADTQLTSRSSEVSGGPMVPTQSVMRTEVSTARGEALAATPVNRAAKPLPNGRYGLAGVIASEWVKIRSVRSTMWTLGITVVLGIGVSALVCLETQSHWSTVNRATFDPAGTSLVGLFIGQFAIGVLGALVLSAEYGTGTIRATFSASPRRPLVLVAKVVVFGAVALIVAEIVAFVAFFLGQALLTSPATRATLSTPEALRQVVGSGLYIALLGLFALGLAAIVRHTAGAICAYLGIVLMLPIIIQFLPTSIQFDVRRFLPDRIGAQMISNTTDPHLFSPWIGLVWLGAYALAALVIGAVLMIRRDA